MKRIMKKMRRSTSDIISNLPESVKETILACLPIQDAVRTSVLSTKWRYTWTKLPQLVFDDTFCSDSWTNTQVHTLFIWTQKLFRVQSVDIFRFKKRLLKLELYEVVVTADILSRLISSSPLLERLSLQNSTSIDCLEINAPNLRFLLCEIHAGSICLKNTVQLASVAIGLMASMDVEEFEEAETSKLVMLFGNLPVIEFLELDYYYLRYMSAGGVPKRLPTTLNNLKFLYLNQICFGQLNEILVFLCLIRSSPNLVKIRILVHTDETADDVIDNPVLKLLEKQDWSDVSLNQLRTVEMYDISTMRSELEFIKLLLAKSPTLETMIIEPDPVEVADKGPTTNVISNMSAACVPKRLQPTMNNLKTLPFLEICFGQLNDISLILCLIRSSPNLEKITIQAYVDEETNAVDPVLELLEMQQWLDVSLNQLQTVDFWNLSGTSSELEFVKLLLAISPVLEVIFIQPDSEKIVDKGVRILKQLAQFLCLSPKVEIEFDDPDED